MQTFYVTYGNNLIGKYSKVMAPSYSEARSLVFAAIGRAWSFMYDEAGFAGQVEKYGLVEIPLQAMEI